MVIDIMLDQQKEEESKEEEKTRDEATGAEVGKQPVQSEEERVRDEAIHSEVRQQLMESGAEKDTDVTAESEVCKQTVDSVNQNSDEANCETQVNLVANSSPLRKRPPCYGWISESEDEDKLERSPASFEHGIEKSKAMENSTFAAVEKNEGKGKAYGGSFVVYCNEVTRKDTQAFVNNEQESPQNKEDNIATNYHSEGVRGTIDPVAAGSHQTEAIRIEQQQTKHPKEAIAAGDLLAANIKQDTIMHNSDCRTVSIGHRRINDGRGCITGDNAPRISTCSLPVDGDLSSASVGNCRRVKETCSMLEAGNVRSSHPFRNINQMIKESGGSSEVRTQQENDNPVSGPLASTNAHKKNKDDYMETDQNNCSVHSADIKHKKMEGSGGPLAVNERAKDAKRPVAVNNSRKETSGPAARNEHERIEGTGCRGSSVINKEHEKMRNDTRGFNYNTKHKGNDSRSSFRSQSKLASSDEDDAIGFSASKHDDENSKEVARGSFLIKRRHYSRGTSKAPYKIVSSDEEDAEIFSASKRENGCPKEFYIGGFTCHNDQQKIEDLRDSTKGLNLKQRREDSRDLGAFDDEQERRDSRYPLRKNYDRVGFEKPSGNSSVNNVQDKTNGGSKKIHIKKRRSGWDVSTIDFMDLC